MKLCPPNLPAGFYWYGGNKKSLGHIPKWVDEMLKGDQSVVHSADEPRDGDVPEDESPGEDPGETNPGCTQDRG